MEHIYNGNIKRTIEKAILYYSIPIFEITIVQKFSNIISYTKPQIWGAQKTQSKTHTQNSASKYVIFKPQKTKNKEKTLKETKGDNNIHPDRYKILKRKKIRFISTSHASKERVMGII
jgi:hypothetical protein